MARVIANTSLSCLIIVNSNALTSESHAVCHPMLIHMATLKQREREKTLQCVPVIGPSHATKFIHCSKVVVNVKVADSTIT